MYKLSPDDEANAIKNAMYFELTGFETAEFYRYKWLLANCRQKRIAILNFLKGGTPMMNRLYLELITEMPIDKAQRIYSKIMRAIVKIGFFALSSALFAKVLANWIGG